MADLTRTPAKVAPVRPQDSEIRTFVALVDIDYGQSFYVDPTTGKAGLCDCNASGHEQFRGIALTKAKAGQAFDGLMEGEVSGFDLSGVNYDAIVYASDTAGELATAAGTKTVQVGRVLPQSDSAGTKVLYVDADMRRNW